MDLEEVKRFLPIRTAEDSAQIKDTNRALVHTHTRKIKSYLDEFREWVLPAITLAVTADNVQFAPNGNDRVGELQITNSDDNDRSQRDPIDGRSPRAVPDVP